MPDIQLLMLSTWSGRGATERKVLDDLRYVVDEVYETSSRLPGSKVGRYWCMWGWNELERVDLRGCVPAGGQWDNLNGQAAAGSVKDCGVGQGCTLPGWVSCDWLGGNIEKLIR